MGILLGALVWAVCALAPVVGGGAAHAAEGDARCLALTLYWEVRDEGREGMTAVGWVVLNRQRTAKNAATICQVVKEGGEDAPCQFSFWCDGKTDEPDEPESWSLARAVASELLSSPPPDPTRGGLFYHRTDVRPAWARQRQLTARIGRHLYYR